MTSVDQRDPGGGEAVRVGLAFVAEEVETAGGHVRRGEAVEAVVVEDRCAGVAVQGRVSDVLVAVPGPFVPVEAEARTELPMRPR